MVCGANGQLLRAGGAVLHAAHVGLHVDLRDAAGAVGGPHLHDSHRVTLCLTGLVLTGNACGCLSGCRGLILRGYNQDSKLKFRIYGSKVGCGTVLRCCTR